MSKDKTIKKLEINKETLRSLVDLSEVRGGGDAEKAERGTIIQVTENKNGKGGSWFLCCK